MKDWITKQCSRPKCIDHWTATSRNDNDLINEYPLFVSAQVPLKFGDMDVASNTARFSVQPTGWGIIRFTQNEAREPSLQFTQRYVGYIKSY